MELKPPFGEENIDSLRLPLGREVDIENGWKAVVAIDEDDEELAVSLDLVTTTEVGLWMTCEQAVALADMLLKAVCAHRDASDRR